jgi:hypothetical protein
MLYKRQTWSKELPSDSEIIATVFCRLLDDAFFKNNTDKMKNGVNHYMDLTMVHNVAMIPEDQFGIINTQQVGYIPYF